MKCVEHKWFLRLIALAALWLLAAAGRFEPTAQSAGQVQNLPAQATVRFEATSTLHDFGGQLPAQPFTLVISNGTWFASADVLSGSMATANEKRDNKMHQMLKTNLFPRIRGVVARAPVPVGSETNVTLALAILDKTNALPVRITGWTETPRDIKFHAAWELSLDTYALKPPSVIGLIRVGDKVKLQADVTATKTAPSNAPATPPP